jgi:hypothetical protein
MRTCSKTLIIVIALAACIGSTALSEDSTFAKRFDRYEVVKKEKATAFLLATFVPGAGHYYCDDIVTGAIYTVSEVALVAWASDAGPDNNGAALILLLATKALEYYTTSSEVDNVNRDLRRKLSLTLRAAQENTLMIRVAYRF